MSVINGVGARLSCTDGADDMLPEDERNAKLIALLTMLSLLVEEFHRNPKKIDGHFAASRLVQLATNAVEFFPKPGEMREAVAGISEDIGLGIEVSMMSRGSEATQ